MNKDTEKRLRPAEVEAVLRRSAQFNARMGNLPGQHRRANAVLPETVVRVAGMAGIEEGCVRRAVAEVFSEKVADPPNYQKKLLGSSRVRAVREVGYSASGTEEYLERVLRFEQGLKLRYKSYDGASLWDPGDPASLVKRAFDFSGEQPLLKVRSLELFVEEVEPERCSVDLLADLAGQRSEYLSLAGILGITLAVLFVFAGIQSALFLLGVIPAFVAPFLVVRLAFVKTRADTRRSLDRLLDAAERGSPEQHRPADRTNVPPGRIQGLKPIGRFNARQKEKG